MKAVCVTADRTLELRDIPAPSAPQPGYLVIDIEAAAINHGDKTFLKAPQAAGNSTALRLYDVWGASAAGRVIAVGAGVPDGYAGKSVAIYRSLQRDLPIVGLWCEQAHVPYLTCLPLPDRVQARRHAGSLVNIITAYAFLDEAIADGHDAVIVTAGNSDTGRAMATLARRRQMPAILVVRTETAKRELQHHGVEHVLVNQPGFLTELGDLAASLGATAVFDGVGGHLITAIAPILPMNSTIYFYGFLAGPTPVSFSSAMVMMKNITLRRFSNFESATVRDGKKLRFALDVLQSSIDDPLLLTRIGREFRLDQYDAAMSYEGASGAKAVFVIQRN